MGLTQINFNQIKNTPINVKDWGAKGDGTTDDTLAIQAAVNYALQYGISNVYMPDGTYITSNTIHLGYGVDGTNTIVLSGADSYDNAAGTSIFANFVDRPIINIQGGRRSGVKDIWLAGNTTYPVNPWTAGLASAATAANYLGTGWKDTANAPYCVVCIDGYSGTVPSDPYPTPPYPSWITTPASAYGRSFSSDCFVDNCNLRRATVGLCIQPNSNGNGDFIRFRNCSFNIHKVGVSFGNVNARNNDYSNCTFDQCYTLINSVSYKVAGNTNGNFAGNLSNISANYCWQVFNVDLSAAAPSAVTSFYCEHMGRLGTLTGGSVNSPMGFYGCSFQFYDCIINGSTITEEYVTDINDGGGLMTLSFDSCTFEFRRMWFPFTGTPLFKNCTFTPLMAFDPTLYRSIAEKEAAIDLYRTVVCDINVAQPNATPYVENCRVYDDATSGLVYYNSSDNAYVSGVHSYATNAYTVMPYQSPTICAVGLSSSLLTGTRTASGRGFSISTTNTMYVAGDIIATSSDKYYIESVTNDGGGNYTIVCNRLTNYQYASGVYTITGGVTGSDIQYIPYSIFDTANSTAGSRPLVNQNRYFKTTAGSSAVSYVDNSQVNQNVPFTSVRKILWHGANALTGLTPVLPFATEYPYISSIATSTITMSQNANISALWLDAPGTCLVKLL